MAFLTSSPAQEKTVTFNPLTTSVAAPTPLPSPEDEEAGDWPCEHKAAAADGATAAAASSTSASSDAAASAVKKTVTVKLDPNTMRATTDGSGRVTLVDPKRINNNNGNNNVVVVVGTGVGSNNDASAVPINNANIAHIVENAVPAVAVVNAKQNSSASSSRHSVRYSGVTRVMVYSPEQCSAHVGHVCSKHKTVTIPLDSIEAMRRAEIMWPIMR